jgi:hypothetical protein
MYTPSFDLPQPLQRRGANTDADISQIKSLPPGSRKLSGRGVKFMKNTI